MKDYKNAYKKYEIKGNVWLHRNNHNGDAAWKLLGFDKNGNFTNPNSTGEYFISVGCYSKKLKVESYNRIASIKNKNEKWAEFEKTCSEELYGNWRPKFRYSLWRFLFEFKEGDILLVPGNHKDFHVFSIVSKEPIMRNEIKEQYPEINFDDEHDFHYFWKVEPIRVEMKRDMLADSALTSRMKIRGTTSDLSKDEKYKASIIKSLTTEKRLSPESDAALAITNADTPESKVNELMLSLQENLDDGKFEKLIKWYFKKKGADSSKRLSKNTHGEKDADIEAVFEALRVKVYVQAKKHDKSVDLEKALTQISEYRKENEEAGYTCLYWVIYSSLDESFADNYDVEKYEGIRIISGVEFGGMLLAAGTDGIDEAFYGNDE